MTLGEVGVEIGSKFCKNFDLRAFFNDMMFDVVCYQIKDILNLFFKQNLCINQMIPARDMSKNPFFINYYWS